MSEDEPTRRLDPAPASTRRLEPDYDDEYQRTAVLGTSRPARDPAYERQQERGPRWGLPLIIGVLSFFAGVILTLLLTGGGDTVSPEALAEERARTNAALQDAQAQISSRDARIAELEGQLAQVDSDRQAALSAQQQALETQRQALDQREAALNAREQALNERDQAGQGGDVPTPDLPGIDLPDVNLPDIDLPEGEDGQNLLEQLVERIRRLFE